jgi:hypothetical protein
MHNSNSLRSSFVDAQNVAVFYLTLDRHISLGRKKEKQKLDVFAPFSLKYCHEKLLSFRL